MDPITVAMALSQFAPQVLKWVTGSDKAEEMAKKAVDIAMQVTGKQTAEETVQALKEDPSLVPQYRQAVLTQELEFQRLAVQNASDINATMRAEVAAEHWPSYSWRPFIGFCFGLHVVSYLVLPLFDKPVPMLPSELYVALGGILGIASWFRGKMQADPNIPTNNKG